MRRALISFTWLAATVYAAQGTPLYCPLAVSPLPPALLQDGVPDCCDGSDEARDFPDVCGSLQSVLGTYSSEMYTLHTAGYKASQSMRASKHQTKRVMAGMLAWAASADAAARQHYSFFKEHAAIADARKGSGALSPNFVQLLHDAKHAAQQASLEAAMADAAVASMRAGQSVFQASLLKGGCATSRLLTTKTTAGGSAEPVPSAFTYRVCPFRNATQSRPSDTEVNSGDTSVLGVWLNRASPSNKLPTFPLHTLVAFIRQNQNLDTSALLSLAKQTGALPTIGSSSLNGIFPPTSLLRRTANETVYFMDDGHRCGARPRSAAFVFVCDDLVSGPLLHTDASAPPSSSQAQTFRILDVAENGKCGYHFVIGTPLRCTRKSARAWKEAAQLWSATP